MGNVDNGEVVIPERGEAHVKKSPGTVGPNEAARARAVNVCFRKSHNEGSGLQWEFFSEVFLSEKRASGGWEHSGNWGQQSQLEEGQNYTEDIAVGQGCFRDYRMTGRDHSEQRP